MAIPHWPLFGLIIRTPLVELRPPDEAGMAALVALADEGIHPPDYMPFQRAWTREPDGMRQRHSLQYYWRAWATWSPEAWELPLAVYRREPDGTVQLVGVQTIMSSCFPTTRTFETGSWVGAAYQGQGVGKEMRAAVLHLGFAGLGAERAVTGAFADNARSLAVTRALGYEPNGDELKDRDGESARCLAFKMDRADWETRRRPDIAIDGLDPCLELFGLGDPAS